MIEEIREGFYIQKSGKGYRQVYPIKKDITKPLTFDNINWKHLTIKSWSNLFVLILIFGLLAFGVYAYQHDTAECREIIENPCDYCNCLEVDYTPLPFQGLNITIKDGEETKP